MTVTFFAFSASGIFPSLGAGLLFCVVLAIWITSEVIGGAILPRLKRGKSRVHREKNATNLLPILAWYIVFTVSITFALFNIARLPAMASYIGSLIFLAGIVLRQWAIAILGRYFSSFIGVQKDQPIIEKGPYRAIRHPAYSGIFMAFIGIGLAFQSWGAVVINLLVFGLIFGHRIRTEEKMLILELGTPYEDYIHRTKRIIPWLV